MTRQLTTRFFTAVLTASLCAFQGTAWGQIQAGRATNGTLILTDQALPSDATPSPMVLDQLMSLPEAASQIRPKTTHPANLPVNAPEASSLPKQTAEQKATCRGINQRYAETQAELALVERKKAAGTLLIPESGLVTLRQNLATLERMRQLCP